MEISIDEIKFGYNPRGDIGDISELRESIRQVGLLNPLLVRPANGEYEIISGNRRFVALQELDFSEAEVIVREISDEEACNIAFIDNHERKQLNPIEEAEHFKKMIEEFGYKTKSKDKEKSLADLYGMANQAISFKMQLLNLPEKVSTQLIESYGFSYTSRNNEGENSTRVGNLTEGHCRYICQLCNKGDIDKLFDSVYEDFKNEGALPLWKKFKQEEIEFRQELQVKLAQEIIDLGLSVKQVENKVKNYKDDLKLRDTNILDKIQDVQKERALLSGIHFKSCTEMTEIETGQIHLIVTSPPYYSDKEYEVMTFEEYENLLSEFLKESYRVLCPGGRLCLNVGDIPNKEGKGFYPIALMIFPIIEKSGFRAVDKILWKKDDPWVSNPHIRLSGQQGKFRILPSTEYIFIFIKEGKREIENVIELQSSITKEEWKVFVSGLWDIPSVRNNWDHPAQFPDELVERLIKMYSFVGDNVLDPFLGSGTTIKVARALGRNGFGYETNEKYKEVIEKKLLK